MNRNHKLLTAWVVPCAILGMLLVTGCDQPGPLPKPDTTLSLVDARRGFQTRLMRSESAGEPVPEPPADIFRTVRYEAPGGKLAAYLTPDPGDGKKHPAIIWITGGDCNTIGEVWEDAPPDNDQTAAAFRKAGIIMMFPSLRGGNTNPGVREGFLGEVDDVLAAADYLAGQEYVDRNRIYLGGHSTGGTLVLLVAECSKQFRAVFSFGPIDDVGGYSPEFLPFDAASSRELVLRAPVLWLHCIKSPVFVFEGMGGNLRALKALDRATANPKAHFYPVKGADHFTILAPITQMVAEAVLRDNGLLTQLAFDEKELNRVFGR